MKLVKSDNKRVWTKKEKTIPKPEKTLEKIFQRLNDRTVWNKINIWGPKSKDTNIKKMFPEKSDVRGCVFHGKELYEALKNFNEAEAEKKKK